MSQQWRRSYRFVVCGSGKRSLSNSGGSGTACKRHSSLRRIATWWSTWFSNPSVLLKICTAFVMLVSSESANHTGGTDGYVSYKSEKRAINDGRINECVDKGVFLGRRPAGLHMLNVKKTKWICIHCYHLQLGRYCGQDGRNARITLCTW